MIFIYIDNLLCFELLFKFDKIFSFNYYDVENNFMQQIDFKYYSLEDFFNNENFNQSKYNLFFFIIYFNIRSFFVNYDGMILLLLEFQYVFDVIGFFEIKIKDSCDLISNIIINGYDFILKSILINVGGVGFYVKEGILFNIREDFCLIIKEFELLWIEINCYFYKSLVCGILYRYLSGNFGDFIKYFYLILDKILKEKKLCLFMGDFNINLLNFEDC